ncbi:discoidin domain-containing protein [Sulfuriroseicoccus oceanibius]|uniref:Discoidin domain-containing protein n=1 Tax=Sulfuriroseicoccus oceanibius TaxID=2707525 RepID=A0A6B3L9U0_9BACT|nr:discoidin domain-containing protein [Sulfuriroseicoccus oceanibius]QQL46417.1 discoidin domain-containing protein [Sulfuriroseicoccus oceanibius]
MKATAVLTALSLGSLTFGSAATIVDTTYSYDIAPGFSGGGGLYLDDLAGTTLNQANTPFSAGDLNDGVVYNGTNPVTDNGGINSMVAWNPAPLPATIIFDLGGAYSVNDVVITGYAWTPFNLGQPGSVTISYSNDNVTYGAGANYALNGGNGAVTNNTGSSAAEARYVKLAFDGTTQAGDKWGLTEISFDGDRIPEPSASMLLSLAGLAVILRRRK